MGRRSREEVFIGVSDQPKNQILFVRVSKDQRQRYEDYAKEQGLSLSELIRRGLAEICERQWGRGRDMAEELPETQPPKSASD
jgi:hypothetical protein